jgi:hypothetical protein
VWELLNVSMKIKAQRTHLSEFEKWLNMFVWTLEMHRNVNHLT